MTTYYSDFFPPAAGVGGSTIPTPTPSLILPVSKSFDAGTDGVVLSGQLPYVISAIRKLGTDDVSTLTTWSLTSTVGCTATIDAGTGDITITAVAAGGEIGVSSTYKGVTLSGKIQIIKNIVSSTTTGSPTDNSVSTTFIPNTTSTSYSGYSGTVITLQSGASGQISVTLSTNVDVDAITLGNFHAYGKAQYRAVGSSTWIDIASEVGTVTSPNYPAQVYYEDTNV